MKALSSAGAMLVAFTLAIATAQAAVVEVEPNDTLTTAQYVPNTAPSFTIDGSRTFANASDDFFAFEVRRGGALSISSTSPDLFADSILGLFDPFGNLVASNDDGGSGFMSAIDFVVDDSAVGVWRIGFSGFNPGLIACTATVTECYDRDGDGVFDTFVAGGGVGGSTGWDYSITVSGPTLVPAPGTLALVALALPLALRRRPAR